MSLELVKTQLKKFLSTEKNEVICIKGKWGVGKTYLWGKAFKESHLENRIKYPFYSYVSLFGVDSINDVKVSIFENTLTRDDFLRQPDIDTFDKRLKEQIGKSNKIRSLIKVFENATRRKGIIDSLSHVGFLGVKNQIVCFDDFERSGKNLQPSDMLGMISILKENHNCKVVIIINDEELTNENEKNFHTHLEKVCDISLTVEPTSKDILEIAFDESVRFAEYISEKCDKLGVSNIRIIKKINELCDEVIEYINSPVTELNKKCIETIALGVCSVFSPKYFPPIKFIKSHNSLNWYINDRNKTEQEGIKEKTNEDIWMEMLDNYGYSSTEELDIDIFDGISKGYFNKSKLINSAKKIEPQLAANSSDNSYSIAWQQLHYGSLSTDDDSILRNILTSTQENLKILSFNQLNSSVRILREFGFEHEADILISDYIELNKHKPLDFWNVHNHVVDGTSDVDDDLMNVMVARYNNFQDSRSASDIVGVVGKGNYSEEDYLFLSKLEPEEMKSIILSLDSSTLGDFLSEIIKFNMKGSSNANKAYAVAKSALTSIAKMSPLRAMRLKKYGIYLK